MVDGSLTSDSMKFALSGPQPTGISVVRTAHHWGAVTCFTTEIRLSTEGAAGMSKDPNVLQWGRSELA